MSSSRLSNKSMTPTLLVPFTRNRSYLRKPPNLLKFSENRGNVEFIKNQIIYANHSKNKICSILTNVGLNQLLSKSCFSILKSEKKLNKVNKKLLTPILTKKNTKTEPVILTQLEDSDSENEYIKSKYLLKS